MFLVKPLPHYGNSSLKSTVSLCRFKTKEPGHNLILADHVFRDQDKPFLRIFFESRDEILDSSFESVNKILQL